MKTKKAKMEQEIRKAIRILMNGRTYYDGYFDVPFEQLNRIDQATKVLLDTLEKESENE